MSHRVSSPPLVTIVTPSFNQAPFLEEAIESVLGQTYGPIELIVRDGGSTDRSVEILRRYEGRLSFTSGPDGGQARALNLGFAAARGEILGWLNSDDAYFEDAVATAVRAFEEHPECDLVYGDALHVDAGGRALERYPTEDFDAARLAERCIICQPAAFFRRRLLERTGPLREDLFFVLDWELWMRAARVGRALHVPRLLARSRVYRGTKTLRARRRLYREARREVRRHHGYVPLSWLANEAAELFLGAGSMPVSRIALALAAPFAVTAVFIINAGRRSAGALARDAARLLGRGLGKLRP